MAEKIMVKALAPHGDLGQQAQTLRQIAEEIENGFHSGPSWRVEEIGSDEGTVKERGA